MERETIQSLSVPALQGIPLWLFGWIVYYSKTLRRQLLANSNLLSLTDKDLKHIQPTLQPLRAPVKDDHPDTKDEAISIKDLVKKPKNDSFSFLGVVDFHQRYLDKSLTPSEVIDLIQTKLKEMDARIHAFSCIHWTLVKADAEKSTKRYQEGRPLSVLDGVPISFKEEFDIQGYDTRGGTDIRAFKDIKIADSEVVARLRSMGALILGHTCMHELGIDTTGNNPKGGTAFNPYNPLYFPGGSSSGSAASVASGICPISLGNDGGGSIRIPASYCGLYGLKPTFGRVSTFGTFPTSNTVGHPGPLTANAIDLTLSYLAIQGIDEKDRNTKIQPREYLKLEDCLALSKSATLRIGIDQEFFNLAHPDIVNQCESMLKRFEDEMESKGVRVERIPIEIMGLETMRVAHAVTIVTEKGTALNQTSWRSFGYSTRPVLLSSKLLRGSDYLNALKVRTMAMDHFQDLFKKVDVIVTPTTGCVAPKIPKGILEHLLFL